MKKTTKFTVLVTAMLLIASCANEDTTQSNEQKKETQTEEYAIFVSGTEDAGKEQSKTRTSLDYNTGAFYWEDGDNIFVKDDGGTWRSGTVSGTKLSYYKFQLTGTFAGTTYTVFYPGKNGTNDQVTIATTQTQTAPADTKHLGEAGDCGLAEANKLGNSFPFQLEHKAAILVFQPYTNDALLKDCYLTKIEVISNNNLAGTYTLDPVTKKLTGTGTSNTITLTTKGSGGYFFGFPMNTTSASLSTNGAYMVIAPGHHTLQVRYWLKSSKQKDFYGNYIEGTVTKRLPDFDYKENNYYDMTANLQITYYSGYNYYMWDAVEGQYYWKGHEWDNPNPTLRHQSTHDMSASLGYAPQAAPDSPSNPCGYRSDYGAPTPITTPAYRSAKNCPNVNECMWYAMQGNPHWDPELWSTMDRLCSGGMWFKKKSNISGYSTTVAPDGVDYRTSYYDFTNTTITQGTPSNLSDYFYLPALGCYDGNGYSIGRLIGVGQGGLYWSSSPAPFNDNIAVALIFNSSSVYVGANNKPRYYGYSLWTAQ